MKLASLVNLKPLKEDLSRASMEELEALARQAQDIQDSEAGYAQQQGDFDIDKFGNDFSDQKVMPDGGEYYSMNDIQDAIATRLDKSGDVPYDVAIGRMTQDEYDKMMSTVKPDRASFEKSSKFGRMNEGTCGYSVDGKPADKPAGPHLLRKAIRREIRDNFDDRLKSFMGADDFEKATNPKLGKLISNSIATIDPEMSYVDFAKGVAQVLIDEYGTHNYEPFIKELKKSLDSTLG